MAENTAKIVLSAEDRTRAAFDQARRNLASLSTAARGAVASFTPIAAAASAVATALAAINIKGAINLADDLGKLSQRSGVAIENLSALRFAGELADVSFEELSDGLKKLNQNIAAAARGEKEQAAAFEAIGVAVKDKLTGAVRSANDVLGDIAESFAGYADGANKVAIATAAGGKSFEKFIPLLNGGREGIAAARAELEKYGGVVGGDLAKKSEKFNDDITRLRFAFEALKIQAAGGLIDNLGKLSAEMVKGIQTSGAWAQTIENLKGVLSGRIQRQALLGRDTLFAPDAVAGTEQDVARVKAAIADLEAAIASGSIANRGAGTARLKDLRDELQTVERAANAARQAREAAYATAKGRPANASGGKFLPEAPALPGPKDTEAERRAAEALAALRKLADNRVKAIQQGVDGEVDVLRFREQMLGIQYRQANLGLEAFYAQQEKLRNDALQATRAAIDAEIAVRQQELQAKGLKPADKLDIEQQIADARARRAKAEREAGQEAERAAADRQAAALELGASVRQLQAELAALGGDRTAQPLLDVAERVAAARRLLTTALPAGADAAAIEPQVQQYERLLKLQVDLGEARAQFGVVSERLQITEQRIALAQQTGAIGELEALRRIGQARTDVIDQLRAHLAAQEAIAAATNDPDILLGIERTRLELEKLSATLDPLKDKFDGLFRDAGANFFEDLMNGKGIKSALRRFGADISAEISRTTSKELSGQLFGPNGIFKDAGGLLARTMGGSAGGGTMSVPGFAGGMIDVGSGRTSGAPSLGGLLGGLFGGSGAAAPQPSPERDLLRQIEGASASLEGLGASAEGILPAFDALPASLDSVIGAFDSLPDLLGGLFEGIDFGGGGGDILGSLGSLFLHRGGIAGRDGAPTRYHSGGIAGLKPDEVPAILQRDEEVLTRNDPRHRYNGGAPVTVAPQVTINFHGMPDRRTQEQAAAQMSRVMQQAMRRGTAGGVR